MSFEVSFDIIENAREKIFPCMYNVQHKAQLEHFGISLFQYGGIINKQIRDESQEGWLTD